MTTFFIPRARVRRRLAYGHKREKLECVKSEVALHPVFGIELKIEVQSSWDQGTCCGIHHHISSHIIWGDTMGLINEVSVA